MAQPYVGEIRLFAGNFAPAGWAFCAGQLVAISDYDTLFNLIGTTYGGDGQTTFALPDLRGRFPIHQGGGFTIGQNGGVENVTITAAQVPVHNHNANCNSATGNNANPAGNIWALGPDLDPYSNAPTGAVMKATAIANGPAGGPQPHDNMIPYQTLNYVIAVQGVFPARN